MKNPEWSANSKTIHAWKLWVVKGRRWGMRSLCGVRSPHDFAWGLDVTTDGALEAAQRYFPHLPTCQRCIDLVVPEPAEQEQNRSRAMHEHGHEEEIVPGEDEQARRFNQAVMAERGRHAAKGYDAAHDDEHGLDHLLMWSQRYASRGEHVKAQALVQAAREYIGRNAAHHPED